MRVFIFSIICSTHVLFSSTYFQHLSSAWYPSRPKKLLYKLDLLEQEAKNKFSYQLNPSQVTALVVPHAGYDYSGVVACAVYQAIAHNQFKRVIILGPSHYVPFQGIALPENLYEQFYNSLGGIFLDNDVLSKLCKKTSSLCVRRQKIFDLEHSIEVQIPFIQKYCPDAKIIPIIVGHLNQKEADQIVEILSSYLDQQTLLVVTTDLIHFGQTFRYVPFTQNIGLNLTKLDQSLVASLEKQSLGDFKKIIKQTQATVCGRYPIQLLFKILQKQKIKNDAYVVAYDRSTHDKNPEHSVSYVGMIFSKSIKSSLPLQDQLTGYEKKVLKDIGLYTLKNLFNVSKNEYQFENIVTQSLKQPWGVFVTLNRSDHTLRGCIGRVITDKPLYQTVRDMTRAAALEDSRFKPVKSEEIPNLSLAISVLNKPQVIDSYNKIRLGIDGIILKYQNKSALFLPHVATEQHWNLSRTLQELSLKAGLRADAWKNKDAQFEVFQAIDI